MKKIEVTKENCIAITHPWLAEQWHPSRNKEVTPYDVSKGTKTEYWWTYTYHDSELNRDFVFEWKESVYSRSKQKSECPFIARRARLYKGFNDFASRYPNIAAEWDYEKNATLPDEITYGCSKKMIFWKCAHNHRWESYLQNRIRGDGCPYCSGKRIIPGKNDLMTLHPELKTKWDAAKNDIKPDTISEKSRIYAYWKCNKGHSWQAYVFNVVNGFDKCPYCEGRKSVIRFNDLRTTFPQLAAEWNYEKNGIKKPEDFTGNNDKIVWWKCSEGHEWKASINSRANRNRGCPYCAGRKVISGENDIFTKSPELTSEYDVNKNQIKDPKEVSLHSGRKVWWICSKGHSWKVSPDSRVRKSDGDNICISQCPYCTGKLPIVGETDFATLMPEIAEEWNYRKNGNKTPQMFTKSSNKKVWWICSKGHEWKTSIDYRTQNNKGCPYCSGKRAIAGQTDLKTLYPGIAEDWNYDKNRGKRPEQYTPGSKEKVWWKCNVCGAEWRSRIGTRTEGSANCPNC